MEITIGVLSLALLVIFATLVIGKELTSLKRRQEKLEAAHAFKRRQDGAAEARAYAEEHLERWRNAGKVPDLAEFETVARHWHARYYVEPFDDDFES